MQDLRFAIYSRISRDRVGAGLGVEGLQEDRAALVTELGGCVVASYSDNDISAHSGKHRPGYEALPQAIKNGDVDAVAVWHQDSFSDALLTSKTTSTSVSQPKPQLIPSWFPGPAVERRLLERMVVYGFIAGMFIMGVTLGTGAQAQRRAQNNA